MVQEPKRIEIVNTPGVASGVSVNARFGPGTGTIIRRLTNYHNIWGSLGVEPETADANSSGFWILWINYDTNNSDPSWSINEINSGDRNMLIVACGTFKASNQAPFNKEIHLNSSRNLVANQELVLTVHNIGATAGAVSISVMLCAGLSVK